MAISKEKKVTLLNELEAVVKNSPTIVFLAFNKLIPIEI